jgi:hypothetical protein
MPTQNDKRLAQIEKRMEKIKAELIALAPMRAGSLTRQYKDPQARSGPYYQLSYTRDMKSRTDYIPRDCVREVRRLIRNYKRFKALTTEWVDLSIEQSRLPIRLTRKA